MAKSLFIFRLCLILTALCGSLPPAASAAASAFSPRRDVIQGPITGEVLDILDGDTVAVRVHVWIGQTIETHVRIDGIDTPEIKGKCEKERLMAQSAKQEIARLLASSGTINLFDIKLEKYAGRVLAKASNDQGVNIAEHMISKGLARPYAGAKRAGWCS